jgi:outer membrane protein insertion porin family
MGPFRRFCPHPTVALALLALAALAFPAAPAIAEENWTERRPDEADLPRYSLDRISFEGTFTSSEGDLRDAIKSSTSGLLRFRPVNLERLEGDILRLRSFLRREGYWNPSIDLRLLFEPEKRKTRATFVVQEGRRRFVGEILVRGNRTFDSDEILSWTTLRSGDPFDLAATDFDRTEIENRYANEGFYRVEVTADIQADPDPTEPIVHDLVYRINEGPRFFVGEISIRGNEFTEDEIIRRELTLRSGEVLSRERLVESRARLYSTGFFSRVELVPQDVEVSQGRVGVQVRVVERKMRFVGAGVGYGTRDQLRLSGEWGHRNLWGRGKRANVRGLLATELFPVDFVRSRIEGRYVEPRLFRTRTTATGELFYERSREIFNDEETSLEGEYDLSLVGLSVDLNRALTRYTRGWVSLENTWADVDPRSGPEPPTSARPDLTRTIGLTLERDRRNDFFAPQKGFLNRLIGSVSGGLLGGDNDFWQTQLEMSWFRPARGVTLAGRVRVGYARTYGQSLEIPDRLRFKIGGASTVRGYREQEIGAGDFLLLTNVEVRFPLFWVVKGGVFLDGGNAWPEISEVRWKDFGPDPKDDPVRANLTEYRYSTGAGIRFSTPVGPVRLDWGRKLKILPATPGASEEDKWRIHLSLGHVF